MNNLYFISIGIMIGVLICTIILCYYPIVETDIICANCKFQQWWIVPSK